MKTKSAQPLHKSGTGGTNFLIAIHYQENHSWQGSIQWLETGRKIHFRSELELMNLIQNAVDINQGAEQSLRKWEDDKKSDAC